MPEFVPSTMPRDNAVFAPPCIDPLSVKNLEMPRPFVEELIRQYSVRPHDPLIVQVSRFDPWKDPVGVIEAFRLVREEVPEQAVPRLTAAAGPLRRPARGTGGRVLRARSVRMRVTIRHTTTFTYETPARASFNEARLAPRHQKPVNCKA